MFYNAYVVTIIWHKLPDQESSIFTFPEWEVLMNVWTCMFDVYIVDSKLHLYMATLQLASPFTMACGLSGKKIC